MAKISREPANEQRSIYERAQAKLEADRDPEPEEEQNSEESEFEEPEGIEDAIGAEEEPSEEPEPEKKTEKPKKPAKKTPAKKTDKAAEKAGESTSGYKAIYFDVDRSTSSIGGKTGVQKAFGNFPIPIQNGIMEARRILASLSKKNTSNVQIEGMPEGVEISTYGLKGDAELLIFDSISVLANQTRQWILTHDLQSKAALKSLKTKLDYNEYAYVLDSFEKFMQILMDMEAIVICTTHIEQVKDNNNQQTWLPMIEGKSKHSIMKYFDAVLYTKIIEGENDVQYMWLTQSRPGYPAKVRGNIEIDPFIPQDFNLVLPEILKYEPYPKILIAGDSGTGKTTSLATIKK